LEDEHRTRHALARSNIEMNLLIQNGHLIDPMEGIDKKLDVLIENGEVSKVGTKLKAGDGVEVFDATGLFVSPGFIDLHTHLREPGQEHKETILTGTRAAVAGGFTAVCAMANTMPPNDERAVTEMILAEAKRQGVCRVYPIGAVSKGLAGEALAEFADLRAGGCVAFSDDGRPVVNALLMRRALEYSSMMGLPIVAHEEDPNLNEGGVMHEGYVATVLGMSGIPAASEETMTARDVILAELTGGHLHVAHISTSGALEAVRRAKARGLRVTCEVTPHHFSLLDEEVRSFSTNYKMNPPLRSREHLDAILAGIGDGTIDAIATDHAPHHHDEKSVEFDIAPFGITGLETAFSLACDHLYHRAKLVSLTRLVELLSANPAKIFGLRGGTLKEGSLGDVTIFDPEAEYEVTSFQSKARNSPFLGHRLRGKIVATVVGGSVRYRSEEPATADAAKTKKKK
jgi:dihydroorotase